MQKSPKQSAVTMSRDGNCSEHVISTARELLYAMAEQCGSSYLAATTVACTKAAHAAAKIATA